MRKYAPALRLCFEAFLIGLVIFQAARPVAKSQTWRHEVICRVHTPQKVAALTFDDGPDPRFTPPILDELDKHHVKATFFMVGRQMEKYPDIVKEVIRRGHVIGNHTYSHPHDIEFDTSAQVIRELEKCEEIIEQMTGKRTHLFRPPRGMIDGTVIEIANEEGYRTVLWTVCADHHDAPEPADMARRVLRHIRPGGIVLVHDGTFCSRWKDVVATPLIIDELRRKGYRFVTVPELLRLERPRPR